MAKEFAGIELDKNDPYRTRYAEIRGVPLSNVERGFLNYAIRDAAATIFAYAGLAHTARDLMSRHAGLYDTNLAARYGLLTEGIQVQAAIALAAISRNGMCIDTARAQQLRDHLQDRRDQLVTGIEDLVRKDQDLAGTNAAAPGLFQRNKNGDLRFTRKGAASLGTKRLHQVLNRARSSIEKRHGVGVEVPRTSKAKQLSTKAKHWEPYRHLHPFIALWLDLNGVHKLLNFANTYTGNSVVYPHYNVLKRTGRTSCDDPPLQQSPREGGIRECFVPSPGHVLLSVDYMFIELTTLAAVCEFRFGHSKLADAIRAGIDPHVNTAALVRGVTVEDFIALTESDPKRFKEDRQRAKAVNFGVPGGLGALALVSYAANTFGVRLDLRDAEQLRETLISDIYPELTAYLTDDLMSKLARSLGVSVEACWDALDAKRQRPDWLPKYIKNVVSGYTRRRDGTPYDLSFRDETWRRLQELNMRPELVEQLAARQGSPALAGRLFGNEVVATLTGRLRAGVNYTQARNTPFQGLAGDGAKIALFRLVAAGYRVVAFVHDEVLVELPTDVDYTAEANRISQIMCESMREVTGNVPVSCGEPALMDRWSKGAEAVWDEQGRLRVWRPDEDKVGSG